MAHTLQERYSKLIDEKLRASLVTKDNFIFNNRLPVFGAAIVIAAVLTEKCFKNGKSRINLPFGAIALSLSFRLAAFRAKSGTIL